VSLKVQLVGLIFQVCVRMSDWEQILTDPIAIKDALRLKREICSRGLKKHPKWGRRSQNGLLNKNY
jgi:hypothetical protein